MYTDLGIKVPQHYLDAIMAPETASVVIARRHDDSKEEGPLYVAYVLQDMDPDGWERGVTIGLMDMAHNASLKAELLAREFEQLHFYNHRITEEMREYLITQRLPLVWSKESPTPTAESLGVFVGSRVWIWTKRQDPMPVLLDLEGLREGNWNV